MLDDSAASGIQEHPRLRQSVDRDIRPNALAAFNGQNPNGTWTLKVQDLAANGTGNLRASPGRHHRGARHLRSARGRQRLPECHARSDRRVGVPGGGARSVEATGNPAPAFLWRRNTVPIDTAMNPSAATGTLSLSTSARRTRAHTTAS